MEQGQVGFANEHVTVIPDAAPSIPRTPQVTWPGPTIGRVYEPPTPADLQRDRADAERWRQASMRPADKSVAAVQVALDAIVAERALAEARLHVSRVNADGMAEGGYTAPAVILAAQKALHLAEVDAAQFERMEAGMRVSLEAAQREEAAELNRLAERAKEAAQTVARFRAFINRDYPKHAAAIGKGLLLEQEAEAAIGVLRAASTYLGYDAPEPLPRVANGTLREAYRFRACLPGTDVRPVTV